ncbi:hypothetical protein DSUL_150056 [Desulfovibrionales bacterium]
MYFPGYVRYQRVSISIEYFYSIAHEALHSFLEKGGDVDCLVVYELHGEEDAG